MSQKSIFRRPIGRKLALSIGFVSVAGATLLAHQNPASGYEVSLYAMTPTAVWIGLGIAFATSLVLSLSARSGRLYPLTLFLGGLAATAFVGLPIVRGYRFYGHHDSLTHLGWARALREGTILPFDLAYPGIHTVAVFVESITATSVSHSLLLVVLLLSAVSFLFIPLSVNNISSGRVSTTIAAFSAFMLLPITTISTHMHAHPMTQAIFFATLFVYLATKYLYPSRYVRTFSAVGFTLAITSTAAVLFHPQLVAHLLVAVLGICLLQFLGRRKAIFDSIGSHRPLYGQTLFLAGVFVLWTANFGFYLGTMEYVFSSTIEYFFGVGQAGESVASQGASLGAIGVGTEEILLKLFGPHLLFALFAGGVILAALTPGIETRDDPSLVAYFAVGLIGLGFLFAIYLFAPGGMYFRVFGLIMVFVVIVGTLAFSNTYSIAENRLTSGAVRPVFAVGFSLLLILSLLAVFPSPYIYKASPHVSDKQMSGYETAFDYQDEDVDITGLRGIPSRFDDAVHGNADRSKTHGSVSEEAFDQPLATYYSSDQYLVLTTSDYEREQTAYHGLRYTADDFDGVATQSDVDLIQSNGEFKLYYVNAANSSAEN